MLALVLSGCGSSAPGSADTGESLRRVLNYKPDGSSGPQSILELGGLDLNASCDRYRGNRRLRVIAISGVDGASRRSTLSGPALGGGQRTYSSRDFGTGSDAYDVLGSVAGGLEKARLRFDRPDGGTVSVSLRAQTDECTLRGAATFRP